MIKNTEPLSMAESLEHIKDKDTSKFIKEFVKLKPEKAKELRKKLQSLELIKLNEMHLSKLIDYLPEDKEELNKTILNTHLDEDETNKILQTIKEFI